MRKEGGKPVFTDSGKMAGKIVGKVFAKEIKTKHILKQPPALCIDKKITKQLLEAEIEYIIIKNVETHTFYKCSMKNFLRYKFDINRGYGPQDGLRMDKWTTSRPQGSLFDG